MNKELYIKMINLSKEQLIEWLIEEIEDNNNFKSLLYKLSERGNCRRREEDKDGYHYTIYKFMELPEEFFIAER